MHYFLQMIITSINQKLLFVTICIRIIILFVGQNNATAQEFKNFFRDDFNVLSNSTWEVSDTIRGGQFMDRQQNYQPRNVVVINGTLQLQVHRHTNMNTTSYSSGQIEIHNGFSFLYGEIEMRARVCPGRGLFSYLWLVNKSQHSKNTGGLAVALYAYGENPTKSQVKLFWQNRQNSQFSLTDRGILNPVDMTLDFHIYRVVWLPTRITWYIDGKEVTYIDDTDDHEKKIPSIPLQISIALSIDHGATEDLPSHGEMAQFQFLIDYIVIRKLNDQNSLLKSMIPVIITVLAIFLFFGIGICVYRHRERSTGSNNRQRHLVPNDDKLHLPKEIASQRKQVFEKWIVALPHFRLLEIPLMQIEQTSEILGEGQFGVVNKGLFRDDVKKCKNIVAIKSIQYIAYFIDKENTDKYKMFLEEISIMAKVGRHVNIVNLLGYVIKGEEMLMVLEYCQNGSLREYILAKRESFTNQVDDEGHIFNKDDLPPLINTPNNDHLNTQDLIFISYQISRGLQFLTAQSVIHRDLAARNVLVCEKHIVKISDFGLARERLLSDYIVQHNQVGLPITWMAPESILDKRFSHQSDIWSFGILVWEIFSLGETPFQTSTAEFSGSVMEFAHALCNGLQMPRPKFAPSSIYDIMLHCWNINKDLRPSAEYLVNTLSSHMAEDSMNFYLRLDEPLSINEKYNMTTAASCYCHYRY